uniref:Sulfatase N-terminal domain-containing protein n=1 Tax=Panagrolaimus sp. JU765 TaxID=591449 RepID=A0AC34Q743_9BILA
MTFFPTSKLKLIIKSIIIISLILLFFDAIVVEFVPSDNRIIFNLSKLFVGQEESILLFDDCQLPKLDPWDPTIKNLLNPSKNKWKNCTPTLKPLTKLINGQLLLFDNRTDGLCSYRCLLPVSDQEIKFTEWFQLLNGSKPECDIVEVNCTAIKDGKLHNHPYYAFIHAQIYRKEESTSKPSSKPDVHVILFDSVSESNFIRAMPKTQYILREYYEAVNFRYLNKIGGNSLPNGFALLMGKTIFPIEKSPMSNGHPSDYEHDAYQKKPLDDDQFIAYRFQDDGYVTMMSEDWREGVFVWPSQIGFMKTPTTHYMKPFQMRTDGGQFVSYKIGNAAFRSICKERHHYHMEYLEDFISKYPDKPKFSVTWMSYLAHNDLNDLYHADEYFYNFFKNNQEKFSNSFIIFMGDHGQSFGSIRKTAIGEIENKNPFLFLTVPQSVRSNSELMDQIRTNAKERITHYDLYATMFDIANPNNPRISNPILHGNSIFKPLPQPRTCDNLRISFEFCICQGKMKTLPSNSTIGVKGAKMMVEKMNNVLNSDPETQNSCLPLEFISTISVNKFGENEKVNVFLITFTTWPGAGEFSGFILQDPTNPDQLKIFSTKFSRHNEFGIQAHCVGRAKYAAYCFCKGLDMSVYGQKT